MCRPSRVSEYYETIGQFVMQDARKNISSYNARMTATVNSVATLYGTTFGFDRPWSSSLSLIEKIRLCS